MALMTSCPACTTRFRVVPDQLRLHHGLVRCGACDHVFDANTRLETIANDQTQSGAPSQDVKDTHSPEAWYNKPAARALVRSDDKSKAPNEDVQWTQIQPSGLGQNKSLDNKFAENASKLGRRTNVHLSKGVMSSQNAGGELTLTRRIDAALDDAISATSRTGVFDSSERYSQIDTDDLVAMQAAEQQAERRKRRHEKRRAQAKAQTELIALDKDQTSLSLDDNDASVQETTANSSSKQHLTFANKNKISSALWQSMLNGLTILLSMVAGLVALMQLLLMARFVVADSLPFAKPLLVQVCSYANCSIEPAAWLQPLSLDALTLSKPIGTKPNTSGLQPYRMQATVRNSSQLLIKKPDIELTISSVQGTVIARKTLSANSFISVPPASTIKPSSDWVIDMVMLLDEQTVGYTARVVYLP